jgi:hypothetical protein
MKKILKYIVCAIGVLSTAYVLVMFFFSSVFYNSSQETSMAMQNSAFECPQGTEITYRGWGKNGRMRYCEASKNGPWEAWESGYRHILGNYKNGKKHGVWTWYHKDGRVYRIINYDSGTEVTDIIVEEK